MIVYRYIKQNLLILKGFNYLSYLSLCRLVIFAGMFYTKYIKKSDYDKFLKTIGKKTLGIDCFRSLDIFR